MHVIEKKIHLESPALPQLHVIPEEGALVLYGLKSEVTNEK